MVITVVTSGGLTGAGSYDRPPQFTALEPVAHT